jgi:outer membrane protein TolC
VLSASACVPLLGAGAGRVARENLTQAERDVLYDIRSFNRYRQTFVVSMISDYYRVLQQRNSVEIQQASYKSLVESTKKLRMEVHVGQRPAYDLGEAEQRVLSAEQALVQARQRYAQALDSYKIRLALPTDANVALDPNELRALEQAGVTPVDYSEEDAIRLHGPALTRRTRGTVWTMRENSSSRPGLGSIGPDGQRQRRLDTGHAGDKAALP